MDLTLTRSFLAVAEAGSLTRAADRLGITQSALSRRIRQYEEQLGAGLLTRGRQGVVLTEEGRIALQEGQRLVAGWERLREQIAQHQGLESGQVRIGGGATAVSFILPPAIARFRRRHPGVLFHLKEAGSSEIAEDVLLGHLELGIVTLPVRSHELRTRPLIDDDIVLVAQRDHPLAGRERLSVGDLAGEGFVGFEAGTALRQLIDNALREAGLELQVVMELRSIPSILRMVATTGQLAFVSRLSIADQSAVVELPVEGLKIRRHLAVISRQQARLSAAAAAFSTQLMASLSGG
jgi:DNA-binding transcriptional LysR family regulator